MNNIEEMSHFMGLFSDPTPQEVIERLERIVQDYKNGSGMFNSQFFKQLFIIDPFVYAWVEKTVRTYELIIKIFKPLVITTCRCGGERFTTRPIGDETLTTCKDCGREKIDEST